jgi:hypothetical protein
MAKLDLLDQALARAGRPIRKDRRALALGLEFMQGPGEGVLFPNEGVQANEIAPALGFGDIQRKLPQSIPLPAPGQST